MSNQSRAEYMREYRKKNAERLRPQQAEYKRKWRAENRDKEKEYNHKQYLRRKEEKQT